METQNRRFPVTAILPVGKPEMTQCRHRLVIQKQEHLKIAPQVARWSSGPFLVTPVLTVDGLCVPSGDEVATPGILAGRMMKAPKIAPKASSPEEPWASSVP